MAIKEEERGEFAETKVDNGIPSTDVNVRTGMTNDQFDLYQKRDVNQEQEFRDDLYYAIKHGDTEKVKELTGWTRDANRPENSVMPEVTKEAQDNADKKEEEEKRQRKLNEENAAASAAPGAEGDKPMDPLLAFMKDPFGLGGSDAPKAPQTYAGDSLEEAIRRGDWSAAARIMNALRAREENEKQDFTGDGYVAGSNTNTAPGYSAADYGPGFSSDSYGNWSYADQYGGTYNNYGYQAADGSFTGQGGMKVSADGTITLQNGQTYETTGTTTQEDKIAIASADTDIAKMKAGLPLDGPPPTPDQLKNANPPGSAVQPVAHTDPEKDAILAESVAKTTKAATGKNYNETRDPNERAMFIKARAEVMDALEKKIDADPANAHKSDWEKRKILKHDLAVLDGSIGKPADREKLYTEVLGDKYTQNKDLYNAVDYGRFDATRMERAQQMWGDHKGDHQQWGHHQQNDGQTATAGGQQQPATDGTATLAAATTGSTALSLGGGLNTDPWWKTGGDDPWSWKSSWDADPMKGLSGSTFAATTNEYWGHGAGGFYDDNGYNDKYGGYKWDNTAENGSLAGGYMDKNGNYVDKAGNLYLAGNNSDTPDRTAAQAGAVSWTDQLHKAAEDGTDFKAPAATIPTVAAANATQTQTVDPSAGNFSSFLQNTTSLLTTEEASRQIGLATGSNFFDMSQPITGASNVWGTKFFDPAAAMVAQAVAPAANTDVAMTIPPTNPYYKAPSAGASA
jgi:hypothetical protein